MAFDEGHPVPASQRLGWRCRERRGERSDLGVAEQSAGEALERLADLLGALSLDEGAQHLDRLSPGPGRRAVLQAGDGRDEDLGAPELGVALVGTGESGKPARGRVAPVLGFFSPSRPQLGGLGVGFDLRSPGAVGGDLEAGGALVGREAAALGGFLLSDEAGADLFDLSPSLGPGGGELAGNPDDLGDALVVDLGPADPEARGELGAKGRLVEDPGRRLVGEQLPAVDREPPAVLGADLVGDQDVGVELRVGGSGGAVGEGSGKEAFRVDLMDSASPPAGERSVLLEEGKRLSHRHQMRRGHLVGDAARPDRPEGRDGLRRREGDREPGDGVLATVETLAEASSVTGIGAVAEEALEGLCRDLLAGNAEHRRSPTEEESRDLGLGVVVLASAGDLRRVVAPRVRAHLRQGHHGSERSRDEWRTSDAEVSSTRKLCQQTKDLYSGFSQTVTGGQSESMSVKSRKAVVARRRYARVGTSDLERRAVGYGYVQVTSQWPSRSIMKTLPASAGSRSQVCDASSSYGPGQICAIPVAFQIRCEQSFGESNGSRPLIKRFSVSGQMRIRDASLLVDVGGLNAESK